VEKPVFLFPGVGSHHVGMGKYFYDNFKTAREIFEEAGEVLKQDTAELCFSEEKRHELETLENSQTALVIVSAATYQVYRQEVGTAPCYCLGHSLGEYSALYAAGVLSFANTLELVRQRGILLRRAAVAVEGMMAWVINLDDQIVEQVCQESLTEGNEIFVSAYDSPLQSSISGLKAAVMTVGPKLEKQGAIVYPLRLSGPFHCPLMREAADRMKDILQDYTFAQGHYPVIANQNAQPYNGKNSIIENLSRQLTRPIRWKDSIQYLLKQAITTAVEMGPDKVLKHLMKNNTNDIFTYSLENEKDLKMIKDDFNTKK
jgi:[acyl-carrier-protein] S-malonyltransferase